MGLVLVVIAAAVPATLLGVVLGIDDGLMTRLGQICYFLVNTSQYSLLAVFQNIWTPQFKTQGLG